MTSEISNALSSLPDSLSSVVGKGTQAFLQSLSQHARLLSIDTPLPAAALLVERFTGKESISDLFQFDIDCVSTSAHFELKDLVNHEVSLRIMLANGSTRSIHGIVTKAMQLGSDGSLTRYKLIIAPWMTRLTQRRDNYVFQDKSVLDIVEEVLKDYPFANYRFDVKTVLPTRSVTMQYRETDYEFIARLLAEEGLSFYFEHQDGHARGQAAPARHVDQSPESKTGQARHTFVVFDDNATLAVSAEPRIRYHRAAATESADTITHFAKKHQLQSNSVAIGAWDYKKLVATASADSVASKPADVPTLEIYEGAGAYRYTDDAESERIAKARAQSLEFAQQIIHAESSVRTLETGKWFTMTNYGDDLLGMIGNTAQGQPDPHEYVVLSIEHRGANNLFPGMKDLAKQHDMEGGTYRNRFTCTARATPIRPAFFRQKPIAPGAQIAIVVGLDNEEITTERDHRIKIQFPWQRGERAVTGQGLHPSTSNAPGNQSAGTWVRVMEPAAGSNWGGSFVPRIGQEVQVDFINGDIDRPVVVGQVYNGADTPPFHGGDNHPGALAGFKSKEYAGSGFNQWVIDDTPGQLRQTFATSTAATQLNTGYLIHQNGNQRSSYRGTGLELRTDDWTTLRAKRGMFISTAARSSAVSTQLDSQEAQARLKAAEDLSKALSDASVQHQAAALSTPNGMQQLTKTVTGKEQADGKDAPGFTAPIALVDSEAGISMATPASALTYAGQDHTMTAHAGMRVTGGQTVSVATGKSASLFTHAGGAKVIAGNSPVSFQAHTGPMNVTADQAMTVTSSNGHIKIMAKDEILLTSGGGYIKLAGNSIEIACPSSVSVKGVSHDFMGAGSVNAALPILPISIIKPAPETQLESTFALDQLTLVAKQSTKAEFIALVAPIFGFDIPAHTYIKLYDQLRNGSIKNPPIKVMTGGSYPAEFDNKTRTIHVHEAAVERAPKVRDASWLLVTALLHEFGHYIDVVLREDLADKNSDGSSTLAGDSEDDEGAKFAYQIAFYDFTNSSETKYATCISPAYSGPLTVNYSAARLAIQASQAEDAQRKEGKSGTAESFGEGDGDNHEKNPHGSFGHQSIEKILIEAGFEKEIERRQIYFGNWLRDLSQILDPKIVRKPGAPKDFPRHIGRDQLTRVVAVKAQTMFVKKPEEKSLFVVTKEKLGVYRPLEHIDNPTNNDPKAEDPRSVDPDFEPLPSKAYTEVDPATSMKRYISASKEYMKSELRKAMAAGRNTDGFRHFGAALHVLEDYFAHSNFVELSLRKIGYKDVLPWTSPASGKHPYPLVTGMFSSEDVIASTAGLVAETLFKVQWEYKASKPGERTEADKTLLILLEEHSDPTYLEKFKEYLLLRDRLQSIPGRDYVGKAMHYTIGMMINAQNFGLSALTHLVGNSVDDAQVVSTGDPNTNDSTNPSHSQLAKDHDNHPFHVIAAHLAREAVLEVGKDMLAHWNGDKKADPAATAGTYLIHPMDSTWQTKTISDWAKSHPAEIKRSASATEWQALQAEHEKEVRERLAKAGKRTKDMWNYVNRNYDVIFGEKNQVKK